MEPIARREPWEHTGAAWHAAFALFVVVTGVLLGRDGLDDPRPAFALLGLVALAYAVAGGPALHRPPPAPLGIGYLVVAGCGTLALFHLTPIGSVLLFVYFPMVWQLLPTRAAVVTSVVAMAAIGVIGSAKLGAQSESLPVLMAVLGGALVMSVLLGLWITSITRRNQRLAGLLDQLAATRAELDTAHREAGALAERQRLARDIHDTLAQGFAGVVLLTRAVSDELDRDPAAARSHLALATRTAEENLAEARALVDALAPAALAGCPLASALRSLTEDCGTALGVPARFDVGGTPAALPPAHDVALLRIAQEALANVRVHSAATRVEVLLEQDATGSALTVRDDGRGFDPSGATGHGLPGMRARAADLGGTLDILTAPGAGCALTARLPRAEQA